MAATQMIHYGKLFNDLVLSGFRQKVSVTQSLQQLLFDGYEDNLVSVAKTFYRSPFDKFGWMYSVSISPPTSENLVSTTVTTKRRHD